MNIVIATGCPGSGWEGVLPLLQQAGLEPNGEKFALWHDALCESSGVSDPLEVRQALQPTPELSAAAGDLVTDDLSGPLLLADSRALWLLDFWAMRLPQAVFLLFYLPPQRAVAEALGQGVEPQRFLEGWKAVNQHVLEFRRRYRRRVLLLDAGAANAHPGALTNACQRLGIELQTPQAFSPAMPAHGVLEYLLAGEVLRLEREAQRLHSELEANAQPLGEGVVQAQPQPAELVKSYLQQQAHAKALQHEVIEAGKKLQDTEQAREALEDAHKGATQENELLLLQLHQVQEELETTFLEKQQLEKAQQVQDAQQKDLQRQLEEARGSLQSAKGAREAVAVLETEKKELREENELLLLQLHQVQEELEHYFLTYQELSRTLTLKEKEVESQRERLSAIEKSVFWKLAVLARVGGKRSDERKKKQKITKQQASLLRKSGLFDEAWYIRQYADVASAGVDPVVHYIRFGAGEGRNPSPAFDTRFYLDSNPDVAAAGLNPLVHFVKFGRAEGRKPTSRGIAA